MNRIKGTILMALALAFSAEAWAQTPQNRTLDSIPQGWTVKANGQTLTWTAYTGSTTMGYVTVPAGAAVTVTTPAGVHVGTMKVRYGVATAPSPAWDTVNLSTLTGNYTAQNYDVLTGTLGGNYKVSIADGATVMLDNLTINGVANISYQWAGLTCVGDATIVLSGTNTVKGFHQNYPGIYVPQNKTVTIRGDGSLTASNNGAGTGIGGGNNIACGNIAIEGGIITAMGRSGCAGIGGGGGNGVLCGNITITGGTVTATGGMNAAGIGGGSRGSCGNITITDGVTSVTATKGTSANNSIGAGNNGSCGTVTIGGTVTGNITTSPYTYTGNGGN